MLVLSVVLPGALLGFYAMQSVFQEAALVRQVRSQQCHDLAAGLRAELGERWHRQQDQTTSAILRQGEAGASRPDEALANLRTTSPQVLVALVFDSEGRPLNPQALSSWSSVPQTGIPVLSATIRSSTGDLEVRALIDPLKLAADLDELLAVSERVHSDYSFSLSEPSAPPPSPMRAYADLSMAPWLPGAAIRVATAKPRADEAEGGSLGLVLRVIAISVLMAVILLGIAVITRAVAREVEVARLKSDFLSSVSHELRTPLTTIRIMAEMLSLGAVPTEEKRSEYHRNIVSEADRLTRLINNVLDFARIEDGRKKFEFGFGDVADAVYEVERITGDYARKEGFEVTTELPDNLPPVCFDRDALIQALINLVANAVKYSDERKYIELGASLSKRSVRIWVEDHGPGIEPDEIPRLFERFYRGGDHMTRQAGGTGLGLSIVQHIVDAHGGSISVDSEVGRGSRFEIILPLEGPPNGASSETRI